MKWFAPLVVGALALTAVLPSCTCRGDEKRDLPPVPTTAPTLGAPPPVAPAKIKPATIDPLLSPEGCVLGHDGLFLDLGEPALRGRVEPRDETRTETFEREGASWVRFHDATASVTFFATADDVKAADPTLVQARVRGLGARSVVAYVNGKPAATWNLKRGEDTIVGVRGPAGGSLLVEGTNELTLRFRGAMKNRGTDALAEVDWIHVGGGDPDPSYSAPTRLDAQTSATLGGVAKQSLSMRAPSFVRCTGWLPEGGHVEVAVGLSGAGEADVDVRVLRDRAEPVVLKRVHVSGAGGWTNESLPLGDVTRGGTLGALELIVANGPKNARVLLGEPKVVAKAPEAVTLSPPARGVVLVVLGELAPKAIALYGGKTSLPELTNLARDGVVFEAHRASSTLGNGAMATLLTGQPPRVSHVDEDDARLPASAVTLSDMARQAGVVAGYFTANPMTGSAFGFGRSWQTFVEHLPTEDGPAVRVFDDAAAWIDAHKSERFLLVVDARGGHPPWDVTNDELKGMPPEDYGGGLDPKHAAELLSKARHVPPMIRFTDADRARAAALYEKAILAHDAALGRLLGALRAADRDKDTTVLVTSDFGVNEAARVPYGDGDPPEEAVLSVPLVLREASHAGAGTRVTAPTADLDVAPTVLGALGLSASSLFSGTDLRLAAARGAPDGRPRLATTHGGHFALAWGNFVLAGRQGQRGELCDLSLEASCVADIRTTHPLALDAITRRYQEMTRATTPAGQVTKDTPAAPREPLTLDPATTAALRAWGR